MTEAEWDCPDWRQKLPAWVRDDRPMTESEWFAVTHLPNRIWLYDQIDTLDPFQGTERRLRLFASACCRRVWDLLQVSAARRIVELSEAFADGEATAGELSVLNQSPEFAGLDTLWDWEHHPDVGIELSACVVDALEAARMLSSPNPDVRHIVQNTHRDRAGDFVRSSSNYAIGRSPGHEETGLAEQADLLRCIFGNPFRPVAFAPAWRTETVVSLTNAIYAERAFDRLPILADALEEAGCDHADVQSHCRGPGPHGRGCWVVDGVLGKS